MRRLMIITAVVVFSVLLGTPLVSATPPTPDAKNEQQIDNPLPPVNLSATGAYTPYINDEKFAQFFGGYLDQYLFRDDVPDGRLSFDIPVKRYYFNFAHEKNFDNGKGYFDNNGFLTQNAVDFLVSHKILPRTAKLYLLAYDVDEDASWCPEVDYVFVNGLPVENNGTYAKLSGANETWSVPSFSIPVEYIKFPQNKGQFENPPTAVDNRIEIQIDVLGCVGSTGHPAWAVQIDWGMIEIPTPIRPIIFAHGWTGTVDSFKTFDENWLALDGIPSAGRVDLSKGLYPIANTATVFAQAIKRASIEHGVDKFNIFAHSKGGLVTRSALQDNLTSARVDNVITFASPHHGTIMSELPGSLWSVCSILNDYTEEEYERCVDAGREFTRDNMRHLNYSNTCEEVWKWWPPHYEWEGCTPQPIAVEQGEIKYYSFAAIGDEAVKPVRSTTFPWKAWEKEGKPFPDEIYVDQEFDLETGFGEIGDHGAMLQDEKAYKCAVHYLDPEIHNSSNCPSTVESAEVELLTTENDYQIILSENGDLAAGESKILEANLDSGTTAIFEVYSDKLLTSTLVDTNGQIINPTVAETNPNVTYTSTNTESLFVYKYQITNPETGVWQNVLLASDAANYVITNQIDSAVRLDYKTDRYTYRPGDIVNLATMLVNETAALTEVTFTGSVSYPDDSTSGISFHDDGTNGDATADDGVYTAQFNAGSINGYTTIYIDAAKDNIARSIEAGIAVAAQTAQIQHVTSETPVDSNGNGLYDSLDLDLSVNVLNSGHFDFQALLVDGAGQLVTTGYYSTRMENSVPLPTGIQTIKLSFDGQTIQQHGVNGPYTLASLVIFDTSDFTLEVDTVTDFYTTTTYQVNQFERALLAIASSNETPIDNDGDGLFNVLRFNLTIDTVIPSTYELSGRLIDPNGDEIAWSSAGFYSSSSGPQLAQLEFDGIDIGDHGVNGPYTLQDLSVANTTGPGFEIFDPAYTTQAYDVTAFEKSSKVYLPLILKSPDNTQPNPDSLYGAITDYGVPVAGTQVFLRYYNGSTWSTYATVTTNSNGYYQFTNLPNLDMDQRYYVKWENSKYDSSRLWYWSCWIISLSTTDPDAYRCNFDLANVELLTPSHNSIVLLPYRFTWIPRPFSGDDYLLNLVDVSDNNPWWWTDPSLGYVSSYTLNGLPTGFIVGQPYGWWLWVYGANGYGVSYYHNSVTFANAGTAEVEAKTMSNRLYADQMESIAPPHAP